MTGHSPRILATLLGCTLALLLLTPVLHPPRPTTAAPNDAPATTWITNGPVYAVARSGATIYLGGSFTSIGPPTGSFVALDPTSGARDASWPAVNGPVYAIAPDGSGGWFIGGEFTKVGSLARQNLAHIKSDKTVNSAWNPGANNTVRALAVSGNTVYAGGFFTSIGGQSRNYLAAIDASSGNPTSWDPNANDTVFALAVSASALDAGGAFTRIESGGIHQGYAGWALTPLSLTTNPLTVPQGGSATVTPSHLQASGGFAGTPASQTFTLTSSPTNGALKKSGATLTTGSTFTQADVNANLIVYEHNGSSTPSDAFTVTASDAAGGSAGPATVNIAITLNTPTPTPTSTPTPTPTPTSTPTPPPTSQRLPVTLLNQPLG